MFLVTAPFSYLETLTETQEQNQFQNHLKKLVDQKKFSKTSGLMDWDIPTGMVWSQLSIKLPGVHFVTHKQLQD